MEDEIDRGLCNILQRIWTLNAHDDYAAENSIDDLKPYTVDNVPIRKLFVGNIAQRSKHKDLEKVFSKYGKLDGCYLKKNSGKSNYAFVTFSSMDDALKATKDGQRKMINLHSRDLRVMPADSWHQPDNVENKLKKILKSVESNQEMSTEFELNEDALIHKLNDDCLMHIFSFLPIADRVKIERVCKRWKVVSQSSWRTFKKLDLTQATWGFTLSNQGPREIYTSSLRKALLRCGQFLTHIDLSNFAEKLSKSTLTVIARFCPNLLYIDITGLGVSPAGIKSLTASCSNIVEFNLGPCSSQCDPDLSLLFSNNKKLRRVKIFKNFINGKSLMSLPETIEAISIGECSNVSPRHFCKAIETFKNLRYLSLDNCVNFDDQTVEVIALCADTLKELHLREYFPVMSGRSLTRISVLVNLEVLDLSRNACVSDECLIAVGNHCKLLKNVDISSCQSVSNAGLAGITHLPKLEHLNISYLGKVTDEVLTDIPNLRTLVCRGCPSLQNTGLCTLIEESKNVELLDISGCDLVSNDFIEAAIKVTLKRTNNILLKIYAGNTNVKFSEISAISPFLSVLNVDLSDDSLRPDFDHAFIFANEAGADEFDDSYMDLYDDYDYDSMDEYIDYADLFNDYELASRYHDIRFDDLFDMY
ncbi:putative RNA-binding protein EEED8.10 isoform X1 [Phymastichus coffea]|uniref:putative RNA-binding protein EEED8.10 isoform X1 n=1 Tax=Phymastichus coffea TaxID=108790 RepID=UPI00273A8E47|nr:putative RNA-binding protein EEED8.10 isoform X1 [Phymastichus coffea]XP_058794528.1 putative RNA-binding protein EEED8.10 isoform X1 [Phymastichus coffea]